MNIVGVAVAGLLSLCTIAVAVYAWISLGDVGMTTMGYLSLIGGGVATIGLGVALMALLFFSNRKGFDARAGAPPNADEDRHPH